MPEEDLQEVIQVLFHRKPSEKPPLKEVLQSLSTLRNSLEKGSFDSVEMIREGREDR